MPQPHLYSTLVDWYFVLTAPEDYAEEAGVYLDTIIETLGRRPLTLLELGSGGGANAFHYKKGIAVTLTDLSDDMLARSKTLNPDCTHIQGDMRTLRLDREFEAVFVHDAIVYMTTEADLKQALDTAFVHTKPGGVVVIAPDVVLETFEEGTDTGGHDVGTRSLRYLEWTYDPDPTDTQVTTEYAYLLREEGKPTRVEHDTMIEGLFSRETWLRLLREAGYEPANRQFRHSEVDRDLDLFSGRKPV